MKPPSPGYVKTTMGLDYSQGRRKNRLSDSHCDHGDLAPRQVALDRNNFTLGWQLPQRQMRNSGWRQDAGQSGHYSEDSKLDSVSVTLVSISEDSTAGEG